MTGQELKEAAIKLFGERGWTTALAENLGVDRSQIWRYVNNRTDVPGPVEAAVRCWLMNRRPSDMNAKLLQDDR